MLSEGTRGAGRHHVIVGFVETHGRAKTQARSVSSNRAAAAISYRGSDSRDGRRRDHRRAPKVALVEELAHRTCLVAQRERWRTSRDPAAGINVLHRHVQHSSRLMTSSRRSPHQPRETTRIRWCGRPTRSSRPT